LLFELLVEGRVWKGPTRCRYRVLPAVNSRSLIEVAKGLEQAFQRVLWVGEHVDELACQMGLAAENVGVHHSSSAHRQREEVLVEEVQRDTNYPAGKVVSHTSAARSMVEVHFAWRVPTIGPDRLAKASGVSSMKGELDESGEVHYRKKIVRMGMKRAEELWRQAVADTLALGLAQVEVFPVAWSEMATRVAISSEHGTYDTDTYNHPQTME
jgi:hypothetical protein